MSLNAKAGGGDYELAPTGNQQAVCAFVEDIGWHKSSYNGKDIVNHKIIILWELAEKMTKGDYAGRPFMVNKFYTLSLGKKANLRHDLDSWRGVPFTPEQLKDGFDVEKLIGVNCLLNIGANSKDDGTEYREILSVSPLMKGMPKIAVQNTEAPEWIGKMREKSVGDPNAHQPATQPATGADANEPPPDVSNAPATDDCPF